MAFHIECSGLGGGLRGEKEGKTRLVGGEKLMVVFLVM